MSLSISQRPDADDALGRLRAVLVEVPRRIVACSGGIDSLLLATVAHRADPIRTTVAHTVTPAVPGDATSRVIGYADREGWALHIVRSGEFDDERYLSNPTERCYFCKSNLYDAIGELRSELRSDPAGGLVGTSTAGSADDAVILSGANVDDLGEFRPGLTAAAERDVRHPYVEAGITKSEIRAMARRLGMAEADLPASPCLASRLYTGTRVTASRLRAVEAGEALTRRLTGLGVVRCRVRDDAVLVEVPDTGRDLVTPSILAEVAAVMRRVEPGIVGVELDDHAYRPGRAFVAPPDGTHGGRCDEGSHAEPPSSESSEND